VSPQRRSHGCSGQATVELALALPLLMVFLLGAVQLTLVIRGQLAVTHAARAAARAASVSASPTRAAAAAARSATSLERLDVRTENGTRTVRVTVLALVATDVPLVGALIGDVTVSATAVMAVES